MNASSKSSNELIRRRNLWVRLYHDTLLETLNSWPDVPDALDDAIASLRPEVHALANPEISWPERAAVERLVRAAAIAEAAAQSEGGGYDTENTAGVSTSLFCVYLRENRPHDCWAHLYTFPGRLTRTAAELDTELAEAANELTFTAAMAVNLLTHQRLAPEDRLR